MPLTHDQFISLFDRWAPTYDQTVYSRDAEGFECYEQVLARVADLAAPPPGGAVLDVGAGTGNLSLLLQQRGLQVTAVEPSAAMRRVARRKLGREATVVDGHFLRLPVPDRSQDAVLSTYAFHHLTDPEKAMAVGELLRVLKPSGRLVIGDIAWASSEARGRFVSRLAAEGKLELVREIDEEYYTTIGVLASIFAANGCSVYVEQLTDWVWALRAAPTLPLGSR
jgi:putative AdoMet-dependent methyltransferase